MNEITVKLFYCQDCQKYYKTMLHLNRNQEHRVVVIERKYIEKTLDDF